LTPEQFETAVAIAEVPKEIRGFGHIKAQNMEKARTRWAALKDAIELRPILVAAE
jgi:indolepyruvate ferredoxin oxidoreductase